MDLTTILAALPHLTPLLGAVPAVKSLVEGAIDLLDDKRDQTAAREVLASLIAENDAGHARLQGKLS